MVGRARWHWVRLLGSARLRAQSGAIHHSSALRIHKRLACRDRQQWERDERKRDAERRVAGGEKGRQKGNKIRPTC